MTYLRVNALFDVYMRDRATGTPKRVSGALIRR